MIYFKDRENGACRAFNDNESAFINKFKQAKRIENIDGKLVETASKYDEIKKAEFDTWVKTTKA